MESPDAIFLRARELVDAAERAAYLAQACGGDRDLQQRIEDMLRDAKAAETFFEPQQKGAPPFKR